MEPHRWGAGSGDKGGEPQGHGGKVCGGCCPPALCPLSAHAPGYTSGAKGWNVGVQGGHLLSRGVQPGPWGQAGPLPAGGRAEVVEEARGLQEPAGPADTKPGRQAKLAPGGLV